MLLASYGVVDKLWGRLDEHDKADFLRRHYGLWMTYLAAFPPVSARRLLEQMEQGRLSLSGGLASTEPVHGGFELVTEDGSRQFVEYLIDGRGVGYGVDELKRDLLTGPLMEQGLINPHPHGGLQIDRMTYEAIGKTGEVTRNFHILGDLTKGEFLATTDVGRCVAHSVRLADAIAR